MFSEFTEDYFIEQAQALGEEYGVDTRQGSIFMDAATGHCIRIAKFMNDLSTVFEMLAVDTCTGDILTEKASQDGIERQSATAAIYNVNFVGTTPNIDARFFVDSYYLSLVYIDSVYYLETELLGDDLNYLSEGSTVVPVYDVTGLTSCTLGSLYIPGADEESDDSLRQRWQEQKSGPSQNGNKSHYKTWCESVSGVGKANIIPLAGGQNTVQAIIYSTDGAMPADSILNDVQEYIDPITDGYEAEIDGGTVVFGDGLGEGVGNLGAHFVASAPMQIDITIGFSADIASGYTSANATTATYNAIKSYLSSLVLSDADEFVIRISSIASIISSIDAILDYSPSSITINEDIENITIQFNEVPILSEVVIDVS